MKRDEAVAIAQEGRNLLVPASGEDVRGARVAWLPFHALCGKDTGRADYSTLAEKYHTVFITGVPKFRADLGAEFRRFVSLTDILYSKKVALYLQSEVHTDELFAEGLRSDDIDWDELR